VDWKRVSSVLRPKSFDIIRLFGSSVNAAIFPTDEIRHSSQNPGNDATPNRRSFWKKPLEGEPHATAPEDCANHGRPDTREQTGNKQQTTGFQVIPLP
jgi:hypothetical protein